jgi:two-component system chemotaxis response regulator CheY
MKTTVAAPGADRGQGAGARALVPPVKGDTRAAGSRARTESVATGVDPLARKGNAARVLIVDDDPAMRMLCSINLQLEGLVVLEAENGRRGLAQARSERPDLVLTDVSMPTFDGFQLAEALRRDDRTREIPLIFLSGESTAANRARARKLGALAYVTKPFDPPTLTSVVADALARVGKHVRPAPPQRPNPPAATLPAA